jgi:hypothetical protein
LPPKVKFMVARRRRRWLVGALAAGALGHAGAARAQLVQQYFPSDIPGYAPDFSSSVVNRLNLQNQDAGVEIGDFTVRPSVSESGAYESEVLGTPNSASSEAETNASLKAGSDWARNALGISLGVDDRQYPQLPQAGFTNWTMAGGGALTLGDDALTIAYAHLALHLSATDLGVTGVVDPVPYAVDDVRLGYAKLFARFSLTPSFEYQNFTFGTAGGPNAVNYNSLNHQTESGTLTGRYDTAPGDGVVAILHVSQAQFSPFVANDYTDVGGFAGLDFRSDAVVQYRLLGGYETRSFTQGVSAVSTPTFELDAVWTPTPLDTVTATAVRRLDDPTSPFARNQIVTDGRVQLDHELRQTVFLRVSAEDSRSDSEAASEAAGSDRQNQVHLGVGATWNINRHLRGTIGYAFTNSTGNGTALDQLPTDSASGRFINHIVTVGVTLHE